MSSSFHAMIQHHRFYRLVLLGASFVFSLTRFPTFSQTNACQGTLGAPIIFQDFGAGAAVYDTVSLINLGISTTFKLWNKAQTNDGYYSIVNTVPNDFQINGINVWLSGFDHTSNDGTGYMMLVNGDQTLGEFYRDTVTNLCIGNTYAFSSFLANVFKQASALNPPRTSIPPQVRFEIRDLSGNVLDFISSGNIPNTAALSWTKYGITFKSAFTSIVLVMVSTASSGTGNDIVIDDIAFQPCLPSLTNNSPLHICEGASSVMQVTVHGSADFSYSKWQVSKDNGMTWNYIGSTLSQTGNAVVHTVEMTLPNPTVSDDSSLYRLVLSPDASYLTDPTSPCNLISPPVLVRVYPHPLLKTTNPLPTCDQSIDLTNSAVLAGSVLHNATVSYFTSYADAVDSNNTLTLSQAQSLTNPGSYYVRASTPTSPSCTSIQSVTLSIDHPKKINLSAPSSLCKGQTTLNMVATTSYSSNLVWSSSSSHLVLPSGITTTLAVPLSQSEWEMDSLWIKASSNDAVLACPNVQDSVKITFYDPPKIVLPADTLFCSDASLPNLIVKAEVSHSPNSLNWMSTDADISPNPLPDNGASLTFSGKESSFYLMATAFKNGCIPQNDTMKIDFDPLPMAYVGPDTTLCKGIPLSKGVPPIPGQHFKWALVSTTMTKDSVSMTDSLHFTPMEDTKVSLTVTSSLGCQSSDDFKVSVLVPPTITLPSHLCFGAPFTLTPLMNPVSMGGTFTWKKETSVVQNSTSIPSLLVSSSGRYLLEYVHGCRSSASTWVTDTVPLKLVDKQACLGENVVISVPLIKNATYFWNQASTSSSNSYSTLAKTFTELLLVEMEDSVGCRSRALATVSGVPRPDITMNSLPVCEGEVGTIGVSLLNPTLENQYQLSYQWFINHQNISDSTWKKMDFTTPGSYALRLGIGECHVWDSTQVTVYPLPKLNEKGAYAYCDESPDSLLLSSLNSDKHTWYLGNKVVGKGHDLKVHPDTASLYVLTAEDANGCRSSQPISVTVCCAPRLFAPNVITPTSEDVNSKLQISGKYFSQFDLTVFSRWGEVVYNTQDQSRSWDGTYRNESMPIGVYAVVITYEGICPDFKGPYKKVGDVTIVK